MAHIIVGTKDSLLGGTRTHVDAMAGSGASDILFGSFGSTSHALCSDDDDDVDDEDYYFTSMICLFVAIGEGRNKRDVFWSFSASTMYIYIYIHI